eukprot:SAG11_NODE_17904_length_505_cov_0.422604_1_plen_46_part_10
MGADEVEAAEKEWMDSLPPINHTHSYRSNTLKWLNLYGAGTGLGLY